MSETHLYKPQIIFAYTTFQLGPPTLRPAMTDVLYFLFKDSCSPRILLHVKTIISTQGELVFLNRGPMLPITLATSHVCLFKLK